jgi:predicted outer membrane lipoprotein
MIRLLMSRIRNLRSDIAIAGALAATAFAIVAALALFVMVGRLSQRRAEAGATSTPQSLPAGPPAGAGGGERT